MYIQEVVCANCNNRNIIDVYAMTTICKRCGHSLVNKSDVATVRELSKFPDSGHVHYVDFKKQHISDIEIVKYLDMKKKT